jgi:hypothetical protein
VAAVTAEDAEALPAAIIITETASAAVRITQSLP